MKTGTVQSRPAECESLVYVGIDDTDNLESRGTGFRARQLAARIIETGLGLVHGITRHQLFVSPEIPYTSHNSAACLAVTLGEAAAIRDLAAFCRVFLDKESAPGSDAGFCIRSGSDVPDAVKDFGRKAKDTVLTAEDAHELAEANGCHLEGVTGDHGGVIGALSSVGLRAGGVDGRFIWVQGLREMARTKLSLQSLLAGTGVDCVQTRDGRVLDDPREQIDLGEWPRPVLRVHMAALLVEENDDLSHARWRVVPKDYIKRF